MKSFSVFLEELESLGLPKALLEEVHQEINDILNHPTLPPEHKFNMITKKVRDLSKKGEDTGLEEGKPKKGSSRAVVFPKEAKDIKIDGKPAKEKTALKVAFHGTLDKHRKQGEPLLGELQNQVESDGYNQHHSVLEKTGDNEYKYHPHGVLAPVHESHDEGHHLLMSHVSPMKKSDFKRLTVTKDHPKGISFDDMYHSLNKEHAEAHGKSHWRHVDEDKHEHVMSHPWVENYSHWMHNTGNHPGDIAPRNFGIWKHPITGKEHPVASDFGFSNEVDKQYGTLRQRARQQSRGY